MLATSREYLWIAGETLIDVPPLARGREASASDAVQLFVERARAARPDVRPAGPADRGCGDRDLPDPRRTAAGHRAGGGTNGRHERGRGAGPAWRSLPAAARSRRGSPSGSRRCCVQWDGRMTCSTPMSSGCCATPRCSPAGSTCRASRPSSVPTTSRCSAQLDSLVGKSLVVADHSADRTRYRLYETIRQFAEDRLAESGGLDADARSACGRTSPARPRRAGSAGTARAGAKPSTGSRRSSAISAPAFRWSSARAGPDGRHRHRRPRGADGVLGRAVRDGVVGGGTARLRDRGADVPRLPRLLTAAGYACFVGRAEAATASAHRAAELESLPGYEPCEPGYATFVEALGQVYCGHLDRYVELTGSVAEQFGDDRGLRTRVVRRRPAGERPGRRGPRARRPVDRRGSRPRQPVLDRLRPLDRRPRPRRRPTARARSRRGTRPSTTSASTESISSTGSWPATPRACTRPTATPSRALALFDTAVSASHQAGNVAAARHHPGQRAGPARAARSRRGRDDVVRRTVPRAREPSPRPRARRARRAAGGTARRRTRGRAASRRARTSTSTRPRPGRCDELSRGAQRPAAARTPRVVPAASAVARSTCSS